MNWINSVGGPFIILEEKLLPFWSGSDNNSDTSDYDRACSINDYIGLIEVGPGHGLILGDEPLQTAWWTSPNLSSGVIARWEWAINENSVINALSHIHEEIWERTNLSLDILKGPLILFDAVCSGENVDCMQSNCKLLIHISPGRYNIRAAHYRPDKDTSLILYQLALVSN